MTWPERRWRDAALVALAAGRCGGAEWTSLVGLVRTLLYSRMLWMAASNWNGKAVRPSRERVLAVTQDSVAAVADAVT
jgi:hypothetical protein